MLAALDEGHYVYIRSGTDHRFIGVWPIVVERRLFIRSWNDKPTGWYRAFLAEPRGAIRIGDKIVPVRAKRLRSERLNETIDRAYLEKYNSKGNLKYSKGLAEPARRATTTELTPA